MLSFPLTTEQLIWESYIERDYDDRMHLLAMKDNSSDQICGLIFWLDLTEQEMKEWVNKNYAKRRTLVSSSDRVSSSPDSLSSLSVALEETIRNDTNSDNKNTEIVPKNQLQNRKLVARTPATTSSPYHGWVKIELIKTAKQYRGRGIGKLLMASALVLATQVSTSSLKCTYKIKKHHISNIRWIDRSI